MIDATQIAIICATKDRPDKIRNLLESVTRLRCQPSQILIADGGHNLESLVNTFAERLNVSCLYCPEPGQILQRNYAHSMLHKDIRLVLHLDDDITLESTTLDQALDHWNRLNLETGKPLAGMAFNVTNLPRKNDNLLRRLAMMRVEPMGRVWPSGFASPHVPIPRGNGEIMETSWLVGGAALWSREVLEIPHPLSFPTRWAVCEDVIFSYPLSRNNRLVVCSDAVVGHNDSYDHHDFAKSMFYGKSQVIMRYFLVASNDDLSKLAFFWSNGLHMLGYLALAILGNENALGTGMGMMSGFVKVLSAQFTRRSHIDLARELAE